MNSEPVSAPMSCSRDRRENKMPTPGGTPINPRTVRRALCSTDNGDDAPTRRRDEDWPGRLLVGQQRPTGR